MTTEQEEPIDVTTSIEEVTPGESHLARRGIFGVAAGGLAAAVFAMRGDGDNTETVAAGGRAAGAAPASRRSPAAAPAPRRRAAPTEGDLAIAAIAASLEVLAVNTYGAALDAAGSGALGEVPPAVAEYVTVAKAHHEAHRDAWNGVLTASGKEAVTWAPPDLEQTVNDQFAMVTDVTGAAQLALTLEGIAAATYLSVLSKLESTDAIALAGSIQPIDRQHMAILTFALGMYPVPDVFASVDDAYTGPGAPTAMPETR